MKRKPRTITLKRKLDKLFAALIRQRDCFVMCVSCGKKPSEQAGHFIKREILSTRWHPWNVNGECRGCNGFDTRHLIGYYASVEKRYGKGTAEDLMNLSHIRWKPLPDQLERLILACDCMENYESAWFAVQREFAASWSGEHEPRT
jgi:Bacteriophage Lambda NinG protein